ncbi:hypothetical protein Salat_2515200 [Sesamum alatum]|uniref:Transposase MuDR plant domain-containing protein n=1 Tax=Sesamum alatum TaxID=300844 RepID=A0AAE2CCB8_9LAMI|nr:hypothetical protein Salat_2515200 [Sesamum alatum]
MGGRLGYTLMQLQTPKLLEELVQNEGEEEPVQRNKDKGKGVVIDEGGDDDLYDGEDNVDYAEDDECFDANIDKDAEWACFLQDDHEDEMRFFSDDNNEGDSGDEFDIQKNSDDDNDARGPIFAPEDTFDPKFPLATKFSHKKEFREAVHSHAIMTRRNLVITKKDKWRVYARCKDNGCSWHINALKIQDELGFQIRE